MLFGYTLERLFYPHVQTGVLKTQTRRMIKNEQNLRMVNGVATIFDKGHPRYWTGKREPILAGHGEEPLASFIMTVCGYEDVRDIGIEGVDKEGFATVYEFMNVWTAMHDKNMWKAFPEHDLSQPSEVLLGLAKRPRKYYQAWILGISIDIHSINYRHPRLADFDPYSFTVAQCKTYPGDNDPGALLDYFFDPFDKDEYFPYQDEQPKKKQRGIHGILQGSN